ncbi:MAG TPA: hypothetical protein VFK02_07920 [Kofleriaceae bacterium]|nr:hypothetical protein [Kofleriaceae bacterium]
MIARADVEQAILEQEAVLEDVAQLVERSVPLAAWGEHLKLALALALADPSMLRSEGWKAVTLRRHLFGPTGVIPAGLAAVTAPSSHRACAERLRAGLPARVRYRAGVYLLQP